MDAREFEDANAACGLLPGPASTQLAIFCAYRVAGPAGAIVGGLGFIVPAVVLVLALSLLFLSQRRPCGCAAPAPAPGRRSPRSRCRRRVGWSVPSLARVVERPRPAGPLGGLRRRRRAPRRAGRALRGAGAAGCGAVETAGAAAGRPAGRWPARSRPRWRPRGGLGALAWTAFKVGALSFGGGFVIIPLMQYDAVHVYHWMTNAQFLNAVALGQVTPGPVVATVAAVGYAAHGLVGGVLAAAVAFAPSFSFVLLGGGRFERSARERLGARVSRRRRAGRDRRDPRRRDRAGAGAAAGLAVRPVLAAALVALLVAAARRRRDAARRRRDRGDAALLGAPLPH